MLKDDIKEMIDKTGFTQAEIEKKLGKTKGYINKIISGKIKPKENTLRKLVKLCNGDEEYFITALWLESAPEEIMYKFDDLTDFLIDFARKTFLDNQDIIKEKNFKEVRKVLFNSNKVQHFLELLNMPHPDIIESFDNIQFIGKEEDTTDDKGEKVIVNVAKNKMIKIKDNYMSPVIPINSYIDTTLCEKYKNNDIIYVSYKGEEFCRGLIVLNENMYYLYSLNGNSNYIIDRKAEKDFNIIGKVTQVTIDI